MLPLVYLVPGLIATGGAIWEWLRPENDPAWSDRAVFNDRMRQLQSNIANLNSAFSSCAEFMSNPQQLSAWRAYRTNWSAYYKDIGSLTLFDPNEAQINNGKLYASQLAKWIDVLKSISACTTLASPSTESKPPPHESALDWGSIILGAGVVGAIYILIRMSK
jgi:hypothetical protein